MTPFMDVLLFDSYIPIILSTAGRSITPQGHPVPLPVTLQFTEDRTPFFVHIHFYFRSNLDRISPHMYLQQKWLDKNGITGGTVVFQRKWCYRTTS
jgi:hypothetical protein